METVTYHKSGFAVPVLSMLGIAIVVESTAIHFLLGAENLVVTVILAVLHLVSLWWIVAQIRAIIKCPHTITEDHIALRYGTLYAIDIPRAQIVDIRAYNHRTDKDLSIQNFDIVNGATPRIIIELSIPLPVLIMGIKKRYTSYIGLTTDNDKALLALAPPKVSL